MAANRLCISLFIDNNALTVHLVTTTKWNDEGLVRARWSKPARIVCLSNHLARIINYFVVWWATQRHMTPAGVGAIVCFIGHWSTLLTNPYCSCVPNELPKELVERYQALVGTELVDQSSIHQTPQILMSSTLLNSCLLYAMLFCFLS